MEKYLLKLISQLTLIAVIAYVVASAVDKRNAIKIKDTDKRMPANGDRWQIPVAMASSCDEALDYAGL